MARTSSVGLGRFHLAALTSGGSGNTRQRQCLRHESSGTHKAKAGLVISSVAQVEGHLELAEAEKGELSAKLRETMAEAATALR